jgi:hypothetical protein
MVYKYLLPILLIIGLFGTASADWDVAAIPDDYEPPNVISMQRMGGVPDRSSINYRHEYAKMIKYHMYAAENYKNGSFNSLIVGTDAEMQYMRKAIYHATMANNYLKLLDLRSSEHHSVDTSTKGVLESITMY